MKVTEVTENMRRVIGMRRGVQGRALTVVVSDWVLLLRLGDCDLPTPAELPAVLVFALL